MEDWQRDFLMCVIAKQAHIKIQLSFTDSGMTQSLDWVNGANNWKNKENIQEGEKEDDI